MMPSLDDERIAAASDLRVAQMRHALASTGKPSRDNWHRGDWMLTFTGRKFYPLAPSPDDVDIRDIAHALSMLCRYNGHVDRFYSVAEHCVLMSQWVEAQALSGDRFPTAENARALALEALLHDGSEAYCGDMVRPLKHSGAMDDYIAAEDAVMDAIAARFGLATSDGHFHKHPMVKDADTRILLTERNALMSNYVASGRWTMESMGELDVPIHAWSPAEAEAAYLRRFDELTVGAR